MNCWQQLGLVGPCDKRSIKRAYLTRLKQTRPEDDPQGFQRLHEAYEMALANAGDVSDQVAVSSPMPAAAADVVAQVAAIFRENAAWRPVQTTAPQAVPQPSVPSIDKRESAFDINSHIAAIWALLEAGQETAARERLYQELNGPACAHIEQQLLLADAWSDWLLDVKIWPAGAAELIFDVFGWSQHEEEVSEALLQRKQQEQQRQFLFEVAAGKTHLNVDKRTAQMLVANTVDYRFWLLGATAQNVKALAWVQKYVPGWSTQMAPEVRSWWRKPHAVADGFWLMLMLLAFLTIFPLLQASLEDAWPILKASLPLTLVLFVLSTLLSYGLVRGTAWLRVQLAVRVYLPLLARDKPMVSELPVLRRLYARFKLTLMLDGVFALLVLTIDALRMLLQGGHGLLGSWLDLLVMFFLPLFVHVLVCWGIWRFCLRFIAMAPGVALWQKMRDI